MLRKFILLMILILLIDSANLAEAGEKILFVPHDDRPISSKQTAEIISALGYEVLIPPMNLLDLQDSDTQSDELWRWLEKNAPSASAAVVAADSMLYGGLIPSRKHEIPAEIISRRVENFKNLRDKNPNLNLYVFGSLMRTPHTGTKGDIEEPEYYAENGANIFNLTALNDKAEISRLSRDEKNYRDYLQNVIPAEFLSDWLERRAKNLAATKKLIDFTSAGIIDYLIIGRDDNSPLGQTHLENRQLLAYAEKNNLPKTKFQSLTGIDEFNLLLLTRAVNEIRGEIPTVNIRYNTGTGAKTVPAFSDETISASILDEIVIIGGEFVDNPRRADFVLLVNTAANGETFWAHNRAPDGKAFKPDLTAAADTKYFAELVENYVAKNYPVGVADIKFPNGADNALMKILHEKNLLFKLQSYAGWNTATNSTGFALSTGILARNMTADAKDKLLARRYLDDWAYQANIRSIVGADLFYMPNGAVSYYQFNGERAYVEAKETELMNEFARKNLPAFEYLRGLKVTNPWNRMFECDIEFGGGNET